MVRKYHMEVWRRHGGTFFRSVWADPEFSMVELLARQIMTSEGSLEWSQKRKKGEGRGEYTGLA